MEVDCLHPVRVQLRHRGAARRRGRTPARARARRRCASDLAGLRVREALAPRPLPERAASAHAPAAPARGRQLRGDRLGHGHSRGRGALPGGARCARRRVHLLLRRRRPGESSARRLRERDAQRARLGPSLERARAGEDRRVLGRGEDARRLRARRFRARRGRDLPRQESLVLAQPSARARDAEGDRERSEALHDRDRPAPQRDGRDRRRPSGGEAGHGRVPARGLDRRAGAGGADRARLARRACGWTRRGRAALRARVGGRVQREVRPVRGARAHDGAPDRRRAERRRVRGSRRPDEPALDAGLLPAPAADPAHRQLRQAGHRLPADGRGSARPAAARRGDARP